MSPLQSIPPWAIAIVVCLMIATFTECTSNVATATLFLPILASMVCILLIFTMTCMPLVHCHRKIHKTLYKIKYWYLWKCLTKIFSPNTVLYNRVLQLMFSLHNFFSFLSHKMIIFSVIKNRHSFQKVRDH